MLYNKGLFTDEEVIGIASQLEQDPSTGGEYARPVRWMFRDESHGVMFIHYAKWLDEVETEFYRLVELVFNKFCEFRGIAVEEIFSARITLLVQSNNDELVTPEVAYPHECNRFVYFATPTDRPCIINGVPVVPTAGDCMIMSPSDSLVLARPHLDNFFAMFELEYR